ncbi:MAG: tryptophan synthase subunit beta [Neisseriaceae bacterium]|nr:tryptophan synthase subunit beta [Neisseriaceae bacterium]
MKLGLNQLITPDENGYFGQFGGKIDHPELKKALQEIEDGFHSIQSDENFQKELRELRDNYVGRPSPIYHAKNLSQNGANIYFKREDLNHTGSHKINHCLGEVLLAKKLGKKKVIAETGAGQHGVALATAAALLNLECEIHMGVVDIKKEHPNVSRMRILGAKVVPVSEGAGTLKEAVDSAFSTYLENPQDVMFAIGSVVGPAPYPEMVSYFESIVGHEAKEQFQNQFSGLPNEVVACVGGGSNAMGIFNAFLDDQQVKLVGVEPGGEGIDKPGRHAATITHGKVGLLHGFYCYFIQDEKGEPGAVHSVASGLDYPGVGPQHCYLHDLKRVDYAVADDDECMQAFLTLSRKEGIIPALESSHAIAYALREAKKHDNDYHILVNLSGRGDKDIDYVLEHLELE